MVGVAVALSRRGMTVDAAKQSSKDRKKSTGVCICR